ncbi:MAG: PolC-type DNA polymerase III, partial [Ruminococcus sp.]|nr:PolC-type DNA polymerase III [Ruminococcus sp.]MCM1233158.1 PolC-type DNA polymerase III [Ruminococcus flavefaciens]
RICLEETRRYVRKYLETCGTACGEKEIERLAEGCMNVKRGITRQVGELAIIPDGYDVYDFTPIDRPNGTSDFPPMHFDCNDFRKTLPTINILSNDTLTLFKRIEDATGVKIADVPTDDPLVYQLFTSTEPLGLSENIGVQCGTLGIPEFGTEFVMKIMREAQPKTFSDIVKISGFAHGTGVWIDNARELIKNGVALSEVIAVRDDVMLYLIRKGFAPLTAYNIGEMTRTGNAAQMFDDDLYKEFREHDVPDWFAESCKKIRYIFPKAHTVVYSEAAVKLAWFKLHYPSAFYAAVLEKYACDLERGVIEKGLAAIKVRVEELRKSTESDDGIGEKDKLYAYLLVWELMSQGIKMPEIISSLCTN